MTKRTSPHATVAVARRAPRGILRLVSLGPGDDALIPPLARRALARSELVVGYGRYLDAIAHLLRPGTELAAYALGEELERCCFAARRAREGRAVALVSGGDVGVYGMASPALGETDTTGLDVEVVPGVTAAQAAAALLGAPLGHDWCSISLSDLLTPWEVVRRRVQAAAAGDFVVCFYNPRSRARDWQLPQALALLAEHRPPDTPAAIVDDAYRPGQRVRLGTLARLDPTAVRMASLVVVGSSQSRRLDGRMVTPRGYPARKADAA